MSINRVGGNTKKNITKTKIMTMNITTTNMRNKPIVQHKLHQVENIIMFMSSVGDEFPIEQARVRELLLDYKSIGPAGAFGALMIEQTLQRADRAAISGDIVEILRSFEELKDCS